jgi:hypothetical protein
LLDALGDEINELRMLPLPEGLLANELIEVIDQERIMPGITWVGKFAEDFPFLDHHSTKKEKSEDKFFTNHQHIYVKANKKSLAFLSNFDSAKTIDQPFLQYNNIRYTFIVGLFKAYHLWENEYGAFEEHLSKISTGYIWNTYKQLTQDFL